MTMRDRDRGSGYGFADGGAGGPSTVGGTWVLDRNAAGQLEWQWRPSDPTRSSGGGTGAPMGGGGGQAPPPATTTPATAAPATGAATGAGATAAATGMTAGAFDWRKWADWALQAYGVYQGTRPGEFQKAPEDPGLIALRAQILRYMQDSPTRNMLGDLLKPRIAAANNNQFQLPQGARGYNPHPNGYQAPKYDLDKIFGNINSADNPKAG